MTSHPDLFPATATLTDFESLTHGHQSHAPYKNEPVPVQLIEEVYEALRWGPTAMNASPLRILIVQSATARKRLVPLMSEGNQQRVSDAPITLLLASDPNFHRKLPLLAPHMKTAVADFEPKAEFRQTLAHDNAYLQMGYLLLGLRAAGLATGPMNGMDKTAIDHEFFAESEWQSFAVINVGWATGEPSARPRAARLSAADATLTI